MFALPQAHFHQSSHIELTEGHTQTPGSSPHTPGMHYSQSNVVCPTRCTPLQRHQRPKTPRTTTLKPKGWINLCI